MKNSDVSAIAWFGAGVACGTAVALLVAPHSGTRSRRILIEKGVEGLEQVIGEERVEKAQQIYERGRESAAVVHDSLEVAKRARNLKRPLGEDG